MIRSFSLATATFLTLALCSPMGQASESCEQMRDRIERQATAKKVKNPVVLIVTADEAKAETAGKVVGSCGHGKRRIVLRR